MYNFFQSHCGFGKYPDPIREMDLFFSTTILAQRRRTPSGVRPLTRRFILKMTIWWFAASCLDYYWRTVSFPKKNSMKYVVNRIPQSLGIRSRNYQSYIQTLWSTNHFCSFGPHTRPPFNALIHLKHGSEWRSSKVVLWKCKGRCEQ